MSDRISDEVLTGHLTELANDWAQVRAGNEPAKDNTVWWLNQTAYLGERFGVALIDDLLAARNLPSRADPPALPREGAS
jgi:hypothetical protein